MKGTILVTGGTGYIGSHTTVELIQAGYQVVSIDNLSNSNIEVLDGIEAITGIRPIFYEADCNDGGSYRAHLHAHPSIQGRDPLRCEQGCRRIRTEASALLQE